MRKSIFDIVAEKLDMSNETYRLIHMAEQERTLCVDGNTYLSVFKFVDTYCFNEWEYRNHYINVSDFLEALDYEDLKRTATYNVESHLILIELIYNFWSLSSNMFEDGKLGKRLKWCGNYWHLKDVMDDIIEEYNQIVYTNDEGTYFVVVENKPEVTAAAEIMPTSTLSFDVIRYNHRSLKGDLDQKRSILRSLGLELEPKRAKLSVLNKQLESDTFFMLNNLSVRHNNCDKDDPGKYKEYTAKMDSESLEEWYDELYQMILLAFLLLDHTERTARVKELKEKVTGT